MRGRERGGGPDQQPGEANSPRPPQQPGGQRQRTGCRRLREEGASNKATDDLKRGVFRTEDAGILRSS
jgi:hypothetical protein